MCVDALSNRDPRVACVSSLVCVPPVTSTGGTACVGHVYKVSFLRTSGRASIPVPSVTSHRSAQCDSRHTATIMGTRRTASSYEDAVADHTAAADHSSLALGSAVLIGREMQ